MSSGALLGTGTLTWRPLGCRTLRRRRGDEAAARLRCRGAAWGCCGAG